MPLGSYYVGYLLLSTGPAFKSGLYSQRVITGENFFFLCRQLSVRNSFLVSYGSSYLLPQSVLGLHVARSWADPVHAAKDSRSS